MDSFIKNGESVPYTGLSCAAVNTVNQNEIGNKENLKCNANAHENEKESVQIDLSNE
jgi:hypothetical protein